MTNPVRSEEFSTGWAAGQGWAPKRGFRWRSDVGRPDGGSNIGPWLCPAGDHPWLGRFYPVLRRVAVLPAFVALADRLGPPVAGGPRLSDAVLRFADRYGFLGARPTALAPIIGTDPDGQSVYGEASIPGESLLGLWLPAIRELAELWTARRMLAELETGSERAQRYARGALGTAGRQVVFSTDHVTVAFPKDRPADASLAARLRTALEVAAERRLAGRVGVRVWGGALRYMPDSLYAALWLLYLGALLNLSRARRVCPECQEEFVPRRGNQLYCSAAHSDRYRRRAFYARHTKEERS